MRNLIRKILKEFVFKEEYTVHFLGTISETRYKKFILESGNRNSRNKAMQKEIQEYADKLGPILGKFKSKKDNEEKSGFIKIKVGLHFAERVFRDTDLSDTRFRKVNKFEGVDVVATNADKIIQHLMTREVKKNDVIKLKSNYRGLNYEILCSQDEKKPGKPPTYTLELFNQIKGVDNVNFSSKPFDHELNVMNPYF